MDIIYSSVSNAASHNHKSLARFLLDKRATIDAKDADITETQNHNVLFQILSPAIFANHKNIAKLLLEKGVE